ncbi:hypothetical protein D9M72_427900 [compost metagenome]
MPGVHGEQLPFDVRLQVVHKRGARDDRHIVPEGRPFNDPLVERLHRDIQALARLLVGDDPVHGRVGEHGRGLERSRSGVPLRRHFVPQDVRGVDGVLTRHHLQRGQPGGPRGDALGNHGGHELEDVRPHRRGDDVRRRDFRHHVRFLGRGVERPEVIHGPDRGVIPHLVDVVAVRGGELRDQLIRDVGKHEFVACLVQQQSHKAAADVPGSKMDSLHYALTFPNSSSTSSTVVAASSCATWALLVNTFAMEDRICRCSLLMPATPTTNLTSLPFQSMPFG